MHDRTPERVSGESDRPVLPVIVVTACCPVESCSLAINLSAIEFVNRPASIAMLFSIACSILEQERPRGVPFALSGGFMDQIIKAIHNAKHPDDLYPILDALSNEATRIISTRPLNAEQARQVAQYLTEIRLLLTRMAGSNNGPGMNNGAVAAERLAALYGDIEGRVKEMRNDLAGAERKRR